MKNALWLLLTIISVSWSQSQTVNIYQQRNPLAGVYQIGSSAEIKTLGAAVELLKTCGVSDSVIFNIEAGTYSEKITIPAISGAGGHNRIIFRGENQESTEMQNNSTPAANWLIKLDGADHISFENLTLKALNSIYARIVVLTNGADSNSFKNNQLIGVPVSAYDSDHLKTLVYSAALNATLLDHANSFSKNKFIDGNMALNLGGINAVSPFESGWTIRDNTFQNQFSKAVYINYQNNLTITGNNFTSASNYNSYYAIDCFRADSNIVIANNRLDLNTQNAAYGIALRPAKAGTNQPALIYNNFIAMNQNGSGNLYGLYLDNCENTRILYNSIKLYGSSANSIALYLYRTNNNCKVQNNLLNNLSGGVACRLSGLGSGNVVDNNNLFVTGSKLAMWGSNSVDNLTDWRTTSGFDALSLNQNVEFNGAADLHLTAQSLKAGFPLAEVLTDIDCELRDSLLTNIGADEYSTPSTFENKPAHSDLALKNYPNPFNPSTAISFELKKAAEINLSVYNVRGELVRVLLNGSQNFGSHTVCFDANGLNSGVYLYKLTINGNSIVNKAVYIK